MVILLDYANDTLPGNFSLYPLNLLAHCWYNVREQLPHYIENLKSL
jgi:hypothetical protein